MHSRSLLLGIITIFIKIYLVLIELKAHRSSVVVPAARHIQGQQMRMCNIDFTGLKMDILSLLSLLIGFIR